MVEEREYKFLDLLSREENLSQRKIALKTGLSLGMTNIILKKLIKKGYVKIKGLNRRKMRYILTPKGFSEKAKKSYNYTVKTIREFKRYIEKIREFILNEYSAGTKEFVIIGDGEMIGIIEFVFKTIDIPDIVVKKIESTTGGTFIKTDRREVSIWEII